MRYPICIPEALADLFPEEIERTFIALTYHEYIIRGFLMSKAAVKKHIADLGNEESWGPAKTGFSLQGKPYVIWSNSGSVQTKTLDIPDKKIDVMDVMEIIETELLELSNATGIEFHLNLMNDMPYIPTPVQSKNMTVFCGAHHPGEEERVVVTEIFGFKFGTLNGIRYTKGAKGIGKIIYDRAGNEVAQVVQGNIYILVPLMNMIPYVSTELVRKILQVAWNGHLVYTLHTEETLAPVTEGGFTALLETVTQNHVKSLTAIRSEIDVRIRELEKELASCYHERATTIRFERQQTRDLPSVREEWLATWEELGRISEIESLTIVNEALHIRLRRTFLEYEDRVYDLGTYGIRLAPSRLVPIQEWVWSIESTHPKGFFHPHISNFGSSCYGNISSALQEIRANLDIVGLVKLIIRWLSEGYDPKLADVPIEEWPTYKTPEIESHEA